MIEYKQQKQAEWLRANPYLVWQWQQRGIEPEPNYHFDRYKGSAKEPAFVEGLLASLGAAPGLDALHDCVAMLGRTKHPFPARILIDIFETHEAAQIRRAVFYALGRSRGPGRKEWFARIIADETAGKWRGYAVAYCRFLTQGAALLPLIRQHFGALCFEALRAFSYIGTEAELAFLKQQSGAALGLPPDKSRMFDNLCAAAIAKLDKRLERGRARARRKLQHLSA